MFVRTIKDYTDRETKVIFRTTDNSTIREVSDKRGAELIAAGVVEEIKTNTEIKSKTKSKKKEEVEAECEAQEDVFCSPNGDFQNESLEETSGDTQSE